LPNFLGYPAAIKLPNDGLCNLNDFIYTSLKDISEVWVLLKDDYEIFVEQNKKNRNAISMSRSKSATKRVSSSRK
jgi:hypothetical protein